MKDIKINKSPRVTRLVKSMLAILEAVGIPLENVHDRTRMRIAEAVLAVAGIKKSFAEAVSSDDKRFMTTRQIIDYENKYLEGNYSPGSYDDIRRHHLILLTTAGYVVSSSQIGTQSTNNPTRGYACSPIFVELLRTYGTRQWAQTLADFRQKDEKLRVLKFFSLEHEELPDVVAYSREKNLLFMIEAVHSFGQMGEIRVKKLKDKLQDCTATLVFVSAFENKKTFRKFSDDIAWESEVWLADSPDHMIHFNGYKFLEIHK